MTGVQLRRLRLRNLRSYESADLAIPPGITLLVGDVGSGKTSILYAIEMALFGFAAVDPTYLVRHRAPEAEVRLELGAGEHTYEFTRRFRRRTRRGREVLELESASYAEDGQRSSYSVTEIRERAIRLLGFPDNPNPRAHSDLWRWAVYVPQEQMRQVLAQEPEERLETVRKALGLEQYRTAGENAQLLAAELKRRALAHEETAHAYDHDAAVAAELTTTLVDRRRELATIELRRTDAAAAAAASDASVAKLETERERLEQLRAEEAEVGEATRALSERQDRLELDARARRSERAALDAATASAPGRLKALEVSEAERRRVAHDLEAAATSRVEALAALEHAAHLEGEASAAAQSLALLESAVTEASTAVDTAAREEAAARSDGPQREPPAPTPRTLAELEQLAQEGQRELESAAGEEARRAHVLEEIDELLSAGVCPRCHQSVATGDFAAHRIEAETAVTIARQSAEERRNGLARLAEERRSRERYERARQRWEEVQRLRRTAEERVGQARHALEEVAVRRDAARTRAEAARAAAETARLGASAARTTLDAIASLERRARDLEQELDRQRRPVEADRLAATRLARLAVEEAEAAREAIEVARRLDTLAARRAELAPRLEGRERLLDELRRARDGSKAARDSEAAAAREGARVGALVEATEHRLRETGQRIAEQARLLARAKRARELAAWLAEEFRPSLLQLERRLLLRAQAEFERSLATYFTTLVEDPSLIARCDPSFGPSVEIEGEWTPVEALSGGERTALALAYRLALAGVVRSAGRLALEVLILDEPTDGFSPEQVLRMGELLERLALPQVLLVSHESQLAAVADRVVRVEKKDGRSSLHPADPGEARTTGSEPGAERPSAPIVRRRRVRSPRLDAAGAGPPPVPDPGPEA